MIVNSVMLLNSSDVCTRIGCLYNDLMIKIMEIIGITGSSKEYDK